MTVWIVLVNWRKIATLSNVFASLDRFAGLYGRAVFSARHGSREGRLGRMEGQPSDDGT